MKKFSLKKVVWVGVLFASLVFASCSSDDDSGSGTSGAETITDSEGLVIGLTWTVSGSDTPLDDVDLDFELLDANGNEVLEGDNGSSFESERLLSSLADGTYTLVIEHYEGTDAAQYSLLVRGFSVDSARTVTGSIADDDSTSERTRLTVLTIEKTGDSYRFI